MFRATVVASKLREQMAHYFDLVRGDEVVQVLHRGGPVKVLMTQEHYLNLLSRLAVYERDPRSSSVPAKSSASIEAAIRATLAQHAEDQDLHDDSGRVGEKRARQA